MGSKKCVSSQRKHRSRLTYEDFLVTSYGQTPREVRADFIHYKKTGQIR